MKVEENGDTVVLIQRPKANTNGHKKQITSIQGLRGIAILYVLLFHIRDDVFKVGYLGVDIFFLISGYLMCMLMTRHSTLDWPRVIDFYFRRLKRIVPVYLFVILAVLSSAIFLWLYPMDYKALAEESMKPLWFAANIPDDDRENYFVQSAGGYQFFLHLWSLSVEIQFYLFVPLIIFILGHISIIMRIPCVILVGIASFYFQLQSTRNTEHMALTSRVWQFMCGFLAHYLNESRLLELTYWFGYEVEEDEKIWTRKRPSCPFLLAFIGKLINLIATISIIILVSIPIYQKSSSRLILLALTVLIVARPDSNLILCNPFLVNLGDVSYSVYMIHWPVFEWHKYWDITAYSYNQKVSYFNAFLLIVVSILLGYGIEKAYAKLSGYIKDWTSLISVTLFLYLCIFSSIHYLKTHSDDEEKISSKLPRELKNKSYVNELLLQIWRNKTNEPINKTMSIGLNNVLKDKAWGRWSCYNRNKASVPTKYNIRKMHITTTCHNFGRGTKNILLLGNSHARTIFDGVEYNFRHIYKHLTLLANHQCSMIRLKEKQRYFTKQKYQECELFIKDLVKMLEMWTHQIDIIIIGHAYQIPTDPPILAKNLNEDPVYVEVQQLFSSLSKFAKEVVFVPVGHFETGVSPHLKILQRRIAYEQDLEVFKTPIEYNRNFSPNLKKRIRLINCSNCILMEWEDLYCSVENQNCETIDFDRKLTYFSDSNHHSAYGALRLGKYIRDLYKKWANENNILEKLTINGQISNLLNVSVLNYTEGNEKIVLNQGFNDSSLKMNASISNLINQPSLQSSNSNDTEKDQNASILNLTTQPSLQSNGVSELNDSQNDKNASILMNQPSLQFTDSAAQLNYIQKVQDVLLPNPTNASQENRQFNSAPQSNGVQKGQNASILNSANQQNLQLNSISQLTDVQKIQNASMATNISQSSLQSNDPSQSNHIQKNQNDSILNSTKGINLPLNETHISSSSEKFTNKISKWANLLLIIVYLFV